MLVFISHSTCPDKTHLLNWPVLSLLIVPHHLPSPQGWIQPAELPVLEPVQISVRRTTTAHLYSWMILLHLLKCLRNSKPVSLVRGWARERKASSSMLHSLPVPSLTLEHHCTAEIQRSDRKKNNYHDSSLIRQTKPTLLGQQKNHPPSIVYFHVCGCYK